MHLQNLPAAPGAGGALGRGGGGTHGQFLLHAVTVRAVQVIPATYFLRSNIVTLFPTGLISEFPSRVKFKFPHLYTVPSKFEN